MRRFDLLAVDDDRMYLKMLKSFFEEVQVSIHCEERGEDALKAIKETPFRLILTDLHMPGMNGFELTRRVREIAPHIPVVMLTSDASPNISQLAAKAGVSRVLPKSSKLRDILAVVKEEAGTPLFKEMLALTK